MTRHNIISLQSPLFEQYLCHKFNKVHRNITYDTDHMNHTAWQVMQWYKFVSQTGDYQSQCGCNTEFHRLHFENVCRPN